MVEMLFIRKGPATMGGYTITNDRDWGFRMYSGYSKREAIRLYREEYGLKYKHLTIIDYTKN
jgi:hypothetical protein